MNLLKRTKKQNGQALRKAVGPERGLSHFRQEMNHAFERMWRQLERGPEAFPGTLTPWPAMDMAEDDRAVTLRLDVPGMEPKDVDIEISGNLITIRGRKADEWDEKKAGRYRHERYSGSFARNVTLPAYVDTGKAQAKYDKGTLTITVPKVPGKGPKRVAVAGA